MAPRSTYAELIVNNEAYGLYSVEESFTSSFVRERTGNDNGAAYEAIDCQGFVAPLGGCAALIEDFTRPFNPTAGAGEDLAAAVHGHERSGRAVRARGDAADRARPVDRGGRRRHGAGRGPGWVFEQRQQFPPVPRHGGQQAATVHPGTRRHLRSDEPAVARSGQAPAVGRLFQRTICPTAICSWKSWSEPRRGWNCTSKRSAACAPA